MDEKSESENTEIFLLKWLRGALGAQKSPSLLLGDSGAFRKSSEPERTCSGLNTGYVMLEKAREVSSY